MLKIGIISDIHSNYEALKAVVQDGINKVDKYICLGDVLGYGPEPNETIKLLSQLDLLGCVLGNHDNAILNNDLTRFRTEHGRYAINWTRDQLNQESLSFLRNLKQKHLYDEFGIEVYHGGLEDPYWQYIFPSTSKEDLERIFSRRKYDLVFVGHSHLRFSFNFGELQVVNPGSVGQPRNGLNDAQYAIYDTEKKSIEFCQVPYDIKNTAEKIEKAGLDKFLAKRLFLGI